MKDYTLPRYPTALDWLEDAIKLGIISNVDLFQVIRKYVDPEYIEDYFQSDLNRIHWNDKRVQVTWKCTDEEHEEEPNEWINRCFQTIEWEDNINDIHEDGFPERECPICGATMEEDNIVDSRIVKEIK